MSLRWSLLIIGILIVASIYIWEIHIKRRHNRKPIAKKNQPPKHDNINHEYSKSLANFQGMLNLSKQDINDIDIINEFNNHTSLKIIHINIIAKEQDYFNGKKLLQAISQVNMIYGEMNMFHYYGESKKPLFSMANTYQPGTFKIDEMENMDIKGIAVFIYDPVAIQSKESYLIFTKTITSLKELLNGELYDKDINLITLEDIQSYKEQYFRDDD